MAIADRSICEDQRKRIKNILQKTPSLGQSWYLVDANWYKMWKKFVGYDEYDDARIGDPQLYPGTINNSKLLDANEELKHNLMEELEYFLLPEEAWKILLDHFTISDPSQIIKRFPIKDAKGFIMIEIYMFKLKIGLHTTDTLLNYSCSADNKITDVFDDIKELLKVNTKKDCRLIGYYLNKSNPKARVEIPLGEDFTVRKAGLQINMTLILEVKNDQGKWDSIKPTSNGSQTRLSISTRKNQPGQCGLTNLGNTCFMNSALQCLSNVPELTQFFVNNNWESDLNYDNPLGCHGKVAIAYHRLIKEMWSGNKTDVVPRDFKYTVGMYAPIFNGYSQHDCHELMAFVLDGLHEDLNRIKKKPYIEEKESNNRPDEVVAQEAWENYKLRNDSIIVDTFHGLLKSTLVCLECSKMSVKFDPFCYLSLPCPDVAHRSINVIFIYQQPSKRYAKFDLLINKSSTVMDIFNRISGMTGVSPNMMLCKDVYRNKFTRSIRKNSSVSSISQNEDLYIYETTYDLTKDNSEVLMLGVYFKIEKSYITPMAEEFTIPIIIEIPVKQFTFANVYKIILERIRPLLMNYNDKKTNKKQKEMPMCTDEDEYKENKEAPTDTNNTNGDCDGDSSPLFIIRIKGKTFSEYRLKEDELITEIVGPDCLISANWSEENRDKHFNILKVKQFEEVPNCNVNEDKVQIKLTDCIDLFTAREQLSENDPWFCPQCKRLQQATKKFDLWNLPNVLIFQLKRFRSQGIWRNKIDSHIDFPTRDLDLSEHVSGTMATEKYNLIAVANHIGGLNGGHYTARAINQPTGLWFDFNDSCCWDVSEDKVITKQAYILVYKKQSLL